MSIIVINQSCSAVANICANFQRLLITTLLVVGVASCGSDKVAVTAVFSNTQDIEKGTPVFFDGQVIGEVSDVQHADHGSKIEINFDQVAASKLTSGVAVVVNRLKQGAPLELYNRESNGAQMLQDGQAIKGLDSMFQLGAWMLGDAIQLGNETVSDYVEAFTGYLESEKFARDKQVVKEQLDTAKQQANQALKQLGEELDAATRQLASSEQAAADAMRELGEELAPLVEDLAGDGAKLASELQKFAESIEQQQGDERIAGEAFLASLLQTLEQLNLAIEKGADSVVEGGDASATDAAKTKAAETNAVETNAAKTNAAETNAAETNSSSRTAEVEQ